jgi:hypothetical protein
MFVIQSEYFIIPSIFKNLRIITYIKNANETWSLTSKEAQTGDGGKEGAGDNIWTLGG